MSQVVSQQTGYARNASESAYPNLWSGLVGWYCPSIHFRGGQTLFDLSPRRFHGVLTSMTNDDWTISGGKRCLDFDSVNDMVTTNASLTSSMTYSCWFSRRTTGADAGRIMHGSASTVGYMGYIRTTDVIIGSSTGTSTFAGFSFSNNVWYHFACTRDSSNNLRAFINGVESTSGPLSRTGTFTLTQWGRYATGTPAATYSWDGQLDDCRIFDRTLSPSEIRLLSRYPGIGLDLAVKPRKKQTASTNRRRRLLTGMV